jgi:hypothetical protein
LYKIQAGKIHIAPGVSLGAFFNQLMLTL